MFYIVGTVGRFRTWIQVPDPKGTRVHFLIIQVENVQLKFVLLLQQHICTPSAAAAARPVAAPSATDQDKPMAATGGGSVSSSSSSDLVRLLMVPSILRQMVELTKEMLVI